MIQAGDKLPSVPVKFIGADGVSDADTARPSIFIVVFIIACIRNLPGTY